MRTYILFFSFCITLFFYSQVWSHNYRIGEVITTSYGKSYTIGEILGKGDFGTVYKVTEFQEPSFLSRFSTQKPKTELALKIIVNDFYEPDTFREFHRNYQYVTNSLGGSSEFVEIYNHGHLVQNGRPNKNSIVVEMEFLDGVDLYSKPKALDWVPALSYEEAFLVLDRLESFVDFGIRAIQIFAKHKITHSDLSPKNIIINKRGEFKIIDFDFINTPGAQNFSYDPTYAPNEVLDDQLVPGASDFYNLGMIVARFLTGTPPILSYRNSLDSDFELYAMADSDAYDENESYFNRIQGSRTHHKAMIDLMSIRFEDLSLQITHPQLRARFMELAKFSIHTTKYNPIDRSFVWKNIFYSHRGKVISSTQKTSTPVESNVENNTETDFGTIVETNYEGNNCNQALQDF